MTDEIRTEREPRADGVTRTGRSCCRRDRVGTILLLVLAAQGCTLVGGAPASEPFRRPEPPETIGSRAWSQTGVASWYGDPFHGRETASGEVYDMERLTAAHQTLPFGTRIRVENLDNGMTVTVRVNDRGPFVDGRILDVSRRAARELGMIGPGTAHVRITVLQGSR